MSLIELRQQFWLCEGASFTPLLLTGVLLELAALW